MITKAVTKNKCTGCSSCAQICPFDCIKMEPDNEGFDFPLVDFNRCVECGKCLLSCPELNLVSKEAPIKCYLAISKNAKLTCHSSSGGAFSAVAQFVINQKHGIVFGCAFDKEIKAKHIFIDCEKDLHKLQGSKYVQSDIDRSFIACKKFLDQGRFVLFSGTPCQVSGLLVFLEKKYPNLITMGLICHGVPSPALFKRNIHELSKSKYGAVTSYKFRSRENGKKSIYISVIGYNSRKVKVPSKNDAYFRLFLSGKVFRFSCYECRYAESKRVEDFTIGDCDSAIEYSPSFHNTTTSTVLINSKKAMQFWSRNIRSLFNSFEIDLKAEARRNRQLREPFCKPAERNGIYKKIQDLSWYEVQALYGKPLTRFDKLKSVIEPYIPNSIMKLLVWLKHCINRYIVKE